MKLSARAAMAALPPPIQGAVWMVLSGICFTGAAAAVRMLAGEIHFIQISFFRSAFGLLCLLPWLTSVGLGALRTRQTTRYMARSVFSVLANFCWFAALVSMPIADATSLSFTTPLFVSMAAMLFLAEPARLGRWTGLIVGFAGTVIILRPGFAEINVGALAVLASGVLFAASAIYVKVLVRQDPPDTVTLYQLLYMLPINFLPALFVWTWPTAQQWLWAVLIGVLTTTAQRAYVRAYAVTDASAVQPFDFLRLPFAIGLGFIMFAELPDLWTVAGGIVIFASSFLVAHGEVRAHRTKRS